MRYLARIALSCWLALAIVSIPALASEYTADTASSTALTDYLHTHRLPLVGAQVMESAEGDRQLVLFGFVATAFGKRDAEAKARKFLKDPDITVDNRIKIRPELLSLKPKAPSSSAPPASSTGPSSSAPPKVPAASSPPPEDLQAYENQPGMNQLPMQQQFQFQQQNPDWASTVVPLIMMGAMIGLGALSGGSSSSATAASLLSGLRPTDLLPGLRMDRPMVRLTARPMGLRPTGPRRLPTAVSLSRLCRRSLDLSR